MPLVVTCACSSLSLASARRAHYLYRYLSLFRYHSLYRYLSLYQYFSIYCSLSSS